MRIRDYPRPRGDTGIGFHWFPDLYHYDDSYLDTFLPLLKSMGASWLVILSHPQRSIPASFIRGLLEEDIEPVVQLSTPYIAFLKQDELRELCERYASWGVHYISPFKEPNLASRWPKWEEDLPERFMDLLIPCLETIYEVEGIIPLFPPLSPGGDFWDTVFLEACLDILNRQKKRPLYEKMAVAIENYAFNKPLTWGKGGKAQWLSAQPYQSLPGCEDHRGFYLFQWYDEIIRQKVGRSLPLLGTANGLVLGDRSSSDFPPVDEATHAQRSAQISQMMIQGELPNYFFNNAFWLLTAEDASPFAQGRWFRPDGEPMLKASVAALQEMAKESRRFRVDLPEKIRVLTDGEVEVMDLEEYLKGVLPREMGKNAPLEALKAQAVAARCYAANAVKYPRHREVGADICTTTHCQVWSTTHDERTNQAVEGTKGIVATYDDEIIGAFYFGHCDGRTRNSEDVWVGALPYCRSVPCICGYDFMYGHGVGMCQRGAMKMAEEGATYEEILCHYYQGIETLAQGSTYELPVVDLSPEIPHMELWEWPRPPEDNGLGIHLGLDFREGALAEELRRVKDLGLKWVLLVPGDEVQMEKAIRLFWPQGIMPVVRPYALIDRSHDFVRDMKVMKGCGVPPYIQIYNEPGDNREWSNGRPDLPLFVSKWVNNALAVYDAGGYPGLQVLDVGLLREVIAETRRRGVMNLWGRAWFCPHNYGLNHPPTYPYDRINQEGIPVQNPEWEFVAPIEQVNRWREEGKNPGQTIHDDSNGVLGFLAFAKGFEEELGFVPPMICGEGGWQYRSSQDRRYPVIGDYLHASYHQQMFAWFKTGRLSNGAPLPDYLFAVCPWILSGLDADAWYSKSMGTRERTIALVKGLLPFLRELPTPPDDPEPPPDPEDEEWTMTARRELRAGLRGIAGNFPRAGIGLTITDPWGNSVVTTSGSKGEHGPGGFEVRVWANGLYTLNFLDQRFQVMVQGDFLFLTFTQISPETLPLARLASDWMKEGEGEALWKSLEGDERYEGLFLLDEKES